MRHVLKAGDCWFRTGDLMRCDEAGYVFFADRMGDTYRYKVGCPPWAQPSPPTPAPPDGPPHPSSTPVGPSHP